MVELMKLSDIEVKRFDEWDNANITLVNVNDMSAYGEYATIGSILESVGDGNNTGFMSGYNIKYSQDLEIMYDEVHNLDDYENSLKCVQLEFNERIDVQYNGTSNPMDQSKIVSGCIYLIMFYSGTNAPSVQNLNVRCEYIDG